MVGVPTPPASSNNDFNAGDLDALVREQIAEYEALRRASLYSPEALSRLREAVEEDLAPRGGHYPYSRANEYAHYAEHTVSAVCGLAEEATPDVLPLIERAITLTTRTLLRSDDSSGLQGIQIYDLLEAHAAAVRNSVPRLTTQQQRRVVNWIVKYRYDGKQDFFDPDIVAYAPGLDERAIDRYRTEISKQDLGPYGRYPLVRLAVLDRDLDALIAAHGEPHNALMARSLIADLQEAGLQDAALHYAKLGLNMPAADRTPELIDLIVARVVEDGDTEGALRLRRSWHEQYSSWESFHRLKSTAQTLGVWESERAGAESLLRYAWPKLYLRYLLDEDRNNEAWDFAHAAAGPPEGSESWIELCERRGRTHPAEALPTYRTIVNDVLTHAHKQNYRLAAWLLRKMRVVATAAGGSAPAEFQDFLAETIDQNRRRPRCLEEFARARLM